MLKANSLTKVYQDHTALNNLNLEVSKGEIFCLLGQNGAGKTTTINLFLGFIIPTSGKLYIDNVEVCAANDAKVKSMISYIPEVVMLYPHLTGVENLDYFTRLAGFVFSVVQLEKLLTEVGLQVEAHHKRISGYSKGMRQKVGIASALAKNASVIFMDEPTSGLDPKATHDFTKMIKNLQEKGKTVFMATHDIFNAVNVASHIGIMKEGRLIHRIENNNITAVGLESLYLETV